MRIIKKSENLCALNGTFPLISVLIPVYNVEKYLRQCLDSIVNQTYKNIEIVCVNDASPDNSLAILNEYAAKDSRVIIVDKKVNEGLPQARKSGLERSSGEYIIPIDSDDWIELNMLEKMINEALLNNLDMVCCGFFQEFMKDGRSVANEAPQFMQNKLERIRFGTFGLAMFACSVWNKLVKREIYEKVVFPKGSVGEDIVITTQTLYYSEKIGSIRNCFYHYRYREDSVSCRSEKEDMKKYSEVKDNYIRQVSFCKEKFGEDLSVFEPELSKCRVAVEVLNPNKSIVVKEFEVLAKFVTETPEDGIKESAEYIIERVKLNMGKVENTEESYLLPSFAAILHKVKNC
jgi:glycosyltransferase involved in cell wall biosynthesis